MEAKENKLHKRTLLYLASGAYQEDYERLPYDKIILVDKAKEYVNLSLPLHSKCEFWNIGALEAVDEIAQRGILVDCLVSVNEGLFEGGGDYVIFSEFLIGYLSPFLADELLVITDLAYYGLARVKSHIAKMDWGFEKTRILTPSSNDYINPSVFSNERRLGGKLDQDGYGNVLLLRRNYTKVSKKLGRIQLHLIHGSIWHDRLQLDAIGLSIPENDQYSSGSIKQSVVDFLYKDAKTFSIRNLSILEILEHCQQHRTLRIGLTPWKDGAYKTVFEGLKNYRGDCPLEISFYHLNKDDYRELYKYFGEYFSSLYPIFFERLKSDKILWSTFEEVLNRGYGNSVLKLCEQIAFHTKHNGTTFQFLQIKIKLGKLRIYSNSKDRFVKGMIRMVEELV